MKHIPEKDWRLASRKLAPIILQRACQRILQDAEQLIQNADDYHKSYLDLYRLIHERNKEIAEMFDGLRRSRIVYQVASWRRHRLLTDEEFQAFSEEARKEIDMYTYWE